MSSLPTRTDISGTPSKATAQTAFTALYDFVAQRFAVGTSGAGTASAAELTAARASLGVDVAAQSNTYCITAAGGTADAITGAYTPVITALTNGLTLYVRAGSGNATTTPTFKADGMALKTIVKCNNLPLAVGDIAGAGHWIEMQYDSTLDKYVLLNPATGVTAGGAQYKGIQPITSSVASNALTVTLNPTMLDFRSTTLGSGTVNTRQVGAAISIVVPTTATLGTISAVQSRIAVLAIDNAGTVELAVVNITGGNDLSETGLISTTAISAAATSASVVYSVTARTSVPYRVVGYVESTQATAGTWATAPSTIQGQGGQALAAMSSLGYGQTWQNVTGSRVIGTTYFNTAGKPIQVCSTFSSISSLGVTPSVNGVALPTTSINSSTNGYCSFVVPPGSSYVINTAGSLAAWSELR